MYSWSWIKATHFFNFCDWILHFVGVFAQICVEQLIADHKKNTLVGNILQFILHTCMP